MAVVRKCFLRCINNTHSPIILPHKEDVVVGRGPITKISDKKCSKSQVSLCADTEAFKVDVKCLGPNTCGVNGFSIKKDETYVLKHADRLELILGRYIHVIEFEPPPIIVTNVTQQLETKRRCEDVNTPNKRSCNESVKKDMDKNENNVNENLENKWEEIDYGKLLIYTAKNVTSKSKIAAYDVDGTIIITKSGRVFPKDYDDWKIVYSEIPGKLKQLHENGYKIVFMTNQAGIARGNTKVSSYKSKIERIVSKIGVPVQVFVSTGKGFYRKPAPGMWNALVEQKNDGVPIDMTVSFFCGDAAGREANWAPKKKKDFSSSDRLLAINLGLNFFTPEEHFLKNRPAPFKLPEFNPSALPKDTSLLNPPDTKLVSGSKEVIIFVGSPGSGKSSFTDTYLVPKGYHHVNRDKLGSWQKCVTDMEAALSAGRSVVIDNTNPDKESRHRFVQIAHKWKVGCRCFVMATSLIHAKHNNK
ncbi:hypothetical protein L9F63_020110, partial [Diploptera punctata]